MMVNNIHVALFLEGGWPWGGVPLDSHTFRCVPSSHMLLMNENPYSCG